MKGFHLLEILITVALISILTAVSVPFYSQYIAQAHRYEAILALQKLALALETYHLQQHTFKNVTLKILKIAEFTKGNVYRLRIARATSSDYLLQAIPNSRQAKKNKKCLTLSLNSSYVKHNSGSGSIEECWR